MSAYTNVPSLPGPDRARCEHTRLRRRVLYSEYRADLMERLAKAIGHVRRAAWGEPDMTANPFLSLWGQLAVQYDRTPEVFPPAGGEALAAKIAEAGFWGLMPRVQRDCLALREMAVRPELAADGTLSFRIVFPDMMSAEADPKAPGRPVRVDELVYDENLGWITLSLETRPERGGPYYRAVDADKKDVSEAVLGGRFERESYPYRAADGTPFLPYVLYHAAETASLWDPYAYREVVEGSLNIGVLLTFYQHVVRNAAWSQRWVIGARVAGTEVMDGDNEATRQEVVTDPAALLQLEASEGDSSVPPQIGQWSSPVDPDAILRSVLLYERRLLLMAGLQPPDVSRTEADVRSGYSLVVAREAIREKQAATEEQFRRGDLEVFRIVARLMGGVPEDGYRITYRALPKSPVETKAEREELLALLAENLIDRVTVYMRLNPGVDAVEAEAALGEIALRNGPESSGSLNGAQLDGMLKVLGTVSAGQLSPEAAARFLQLAVPSIDEATAKLLTSGATRATDPTNPTTTP